MSVNISALPNPDNEISYLPPEAAHQFEVYRYVLVATAGMFAWELATDLPNMYRLLFKCRISLPIITYILSRYCAFAFIMGGIFISAIPVENCETLLICIGVFYCIGSSFTSLLFYFRVKAIFNDSKWVIGLFTFAWLVVLAGGITVPFALTGMATHVGDTGFCIQSGARSFAGSSFIASAAYDTLVFFFISFRLVTTFVHEEGTLVNSFSDQWSLFLRRGLSSEGLPKFTATIFESGQHYYAVSVVSNVITVAIYLSTSTVPSSYRIMFTVPNLAIVNSMATHVFREVRFGKIAPTFVGESAGPSITADRIEMRYAKSTIGGTSKSQAQSTSAAPFSRSYADGTATTLAASGDDGSRRTDWNKVAMPILPRGHDAEKGIVPQEDDDKSKASSS